MEREFHLQYSTFTIPTLFISFDCVPHLSVENEEYKEEIGNKTFAYSEFHSQSQCVVTFHIISNVPLHKLDAPNTPPYAVPITFRFCLFFQEISAFF